MNEESTQGPGPHRQDGSAPADSAPTEAWNVNTGQQAQWNSPASGPPVSPASALPPWDTPAAHPQSSPPTPWDQSEPNAGGWSTAPESVTPQSGAAWSPEPQSGSGWGAPTAGGDSFPQYVPRISPSPPKQRKPVVPVLIGVVVAAIVAGTGGYFLGASAGGGNSTPGPAATSAAPPLFESAQSAANKSLLDGSLAGLAEPWLSTAMSDCVVSGGPGQPALSPSEDRHVACRYGSAWVHFVAYKSEALRNEARTYRLQLNLNSDEIAPGVHDPGRATGGVTGAVGKMIEYAFRRENGRSLCGLDWERDADSVAALIIEADCERDLGGKWEPLRDLWQRHS
ncbi:hypothetical protein ODJ79_42395 [Actinoplanes sp. KI2]|uniref:hypothetical protein n=1 Tax=Actinoplanes sp. KI2 TaxID=2983315 RepID=UPI0021D57E2C|nr:hypothetical protein [Actinoplanes sp. KI2]MCU7730409.1 hypothetical protein [Actinoplanes sp. KI2]